MYKFNKNQKIAISIILGVVAVILINYVYSRETTIDTSKLDTYEEEDAEIMKDEPKEIVVHVAGAVQTEGIIFLTEGDRISTAIEKAGGTTEDADMAQVNLAYQLEDGMKIYIPKKGEKMEETEEYIVTDTISETTNTGTSTSKSNSKININRATQSELENLPGIGPSTAAKIISHREENGKFATIESIKDVSGIGDAKFNSIKDLITV